MTGGPGASGSWALGCCERGPVAGAGRVRPGRERARGHWAAWAEWSGRVGPGAGKRGGGPTGLLAGPNGGVASWAGRVKGRERRRTGLG
jgi:hypothetical protein